MQENVKELFEEKAQKNIITECTAQQQMGSI